jgi:hypothetical protein
MEKTQMANPTEELTIPASRDARCPFDPPREYARRLREDPITRVRLWSGKEPWLVTRYEDARAVLSDPRFSSDNDLEGFPHESPSIQAHRTSERMMITMDPPQHPAYRRIFAPLFMIKRIEAMRPAIGAIVDDLLDEIMAGDAVFDFHGRLAFHIPQLVVCELLGLPREDRDRLAKLLEKMFSIKTTHEEGAAANTAYLEYLERIVELRMREPGDDVITQLLERVKAGELSTTDVVVNLRLIVAAGFDSTAKQLTLGILLLLRHPDQLAAVQADPGLVEGAVEEILRYTTIVHLGQRRVATEDIVVGGHLIRAGDGVLVAHSISNRDPEAFPNPDAFDIRRSSRHHLAFGFGPHQCLGQPLARLELQIAINAVLRRMPDLRLAVAFEELRFTNEATLYGLEELPVTWLPEAAAASWDARVGSRARDGR